MPRSPDGFGLCTASAAAFAVRHYGRCARLYRSLRANDIRSSRDLAALEGCERLFNRARGAGDIPFGYGLQRALTRADIGAMLVETRNRIDALRSGRAERPRGKGPRFDPRISRMRPSSA
jgi:hypothetical protein